MMGESIFATVSGAWADLRQSPAFWDVDPTTLDPIQHTDWIIARILQFGRWEDWVALFRCYATDQIREALWHRRVPEHVRQFWQRYFAEGEDVSVYPQRLHPATEGIWKSLGPALCPVPGAVLSSSPIGRPGFPYYGSRRSRGDRYPVIGRRTDPGGRRPQRPQWHVRIDTVKVSYLVSIAAKGQGISTATVPDSAIFLQVHPLSLLIELISGPPGTGVCRAGGM